MAQVTQLSPLGTPGRVRATWVAKAAGHGVLKMFMSNGQWVPIVMGPVGGVVDGNKVQFDGTSGGLVKDAGTT